MVKNWHSLRKRIHLICFLIFLALPFLNVIRFDIPKQRFYFAGFELWINEFAIIFFTLMFLMFLVVVSSIFYGRVYCGYLCPQMIFSEVSMALEARLGKLVAKRQISKRTSRALFYAAVGAASVGLAFVFVAYFVPPSDLLHRLLSLDIRTAGGISGAAVTVVTFLDFTVVRQKFCTTVCPYGYLQGLLGDGNTLLVHYRDEGHACIECKKCVRVCPMGIDIRTSPFQIECIHCAECIDACDEILAKLKKPGLIHYVWGEKGPLSKERRQPWDAKRVIIMIILACYAGGLFTALGMRRTVLVRVAPDRTTMYRMREDGRVYNQFRYTVANRGHKQAAVVFSMQQLPGAKLEIGMNPVTVNAGESKAGEFEISRPAGAAREIVSHFSIVTSTVPDQDTETIPMTFLAPGEKK